MALQSRKIFIDSSVLISFIDRSDTNHLKAVQAMENLARINYQLFTSYQNVVEAYAALNREIGQTIALDFLQASLQSTMEILFPQKADLMSAHRIIQSNRERQIALREAINATLMEKRGIAQIVTFTYWHNLYGTFVSNIG